MYQKNIWGTVMEKLGPRKGEMVNMTSAQKWIFKIRILEYLSKRINRF